MQTFAAPFRVEGTDIHLAIQVGISLFPSDAADAEALYKNAKIALKGAQGEGRSFLLYDPAMNERIIHSVTMEAKLRKAIERDQLMVHHQPKVSTIDKSIVGLEALLRYADPEGDLVPPDNFIIPKLKALREMGFQIAIDDFGTGYSSLSYLSQLPVNALKIDRSFIIDMTEHPSSLAIVTSIISLAHSLNLQVIAEGVEREEQANLLRLLRCDLIQGFLYSPPLPAEGIIALLQHGHPW